MSTGPRKLGNDQEIDLGSISASFGNILQSINTLIFRSIQFLLRNIIPIIILFVVGIALGLYLDNIQKNYDHEVIVTPNFGSTDYLYSQIDLIDAKINEGDTAYLHDIGVKNASKLAGIKIKPITDVYRFMNNSTQNFELLKLMAEDGDINKIVEDNVTSKNYTYHTIYISTRDRAGLDQTINPILKFLNSNAFYLKVQKEYLNNVKLKMLANEQTIAQIDNVLNEFSENSSEGKGGNLVYYNENTQLNDVLKTKEELIEEQGAHRLEMVSNDKIIKETSAITNIENNKSINGKLKLVLPLLLVGIFLLIKLFIAFYKDQSFKNKTVKS